MRSADQQKGWITSRGADHETADPGLSAIFQANARRFHAAALATQDRFPRQAAHFLPISIELSLKSYLLHRGFSDGWNRVPIGPDLGKALRCARRAGLQDVPPDLRTTIYRKVREGTFPPQVPIGVHGAGWYESAVNRWLADPPGWRPAVQPALDAKAV